MTDAPNVTQCQYPWKWYVLGIGGDVRPCCFTNTPLGTTLTHSPEAIWNGPTMQSLRASLKEGRVHTVCRDAACKYVSGSRALGFKDQEPLAHPPANFNERWYVENYFDVQTGINWKLWNSGLEHYCRYGHREFRRVGPTDYSHPEKSLPADLCEQDANELSAELTLRAPTPPPQGCVDEVLRLKIRARNSGSLAWPAPGLYSEGSLIRLGGRVVTNLGHINRRSSPIDFRIPPQAGALPGETSEFEVSFPLKQLPPGISYLVFDLVWDDRSYWFSMGKTQPVILGFDRSAHGEVLIVAPKQSNQVRAETASPAH